MSKASQILAGTAALGATAAVTGGTMAAMSPEAEQYRRDAAEAAQAAQAFAQRRAGKSEYWKQKREQLLGLVGKVGDAAIRTLDMPLQGYMGLSAVAGGLASGQRIDAALQQGGRIAAQPTDVTAYQYGQTVTDQLTPYVPPEAAAAAGALVNAGSLLGSPL